MKHIFLIQSLLLFIVISIPSIAVAEDGQDGLIEKARTCYRKIRHPLRDGDHEACVDYFLKDKTGRGKVSVRQVLRKRGTRRGYYFHHGGKSSWKTVNGDVVLTSQSYWVAMPVEKVRTYRKVYVFEETFRFVPVDEDMLVDEYKLNEVTEASLADAEEHVTRWRERFEDASLAKEQRLQAGLRLGLSLWGIADVDRFWPHVQKLDDAGLREYPEALKLRQQLVQRWVRKEEPPKDYAKLVESILSWKQSK